MPGLDLDLVRHAIETAQKQGFGDVELAVGNDTFSAKLGTKTKVKSASQNGAATVLDPPETVDVKAALVGYFRMGKARLEVGSPISVGEVVGQIAALGIASDVESPATGEVIEVLVKNNQAVEYGQVLARIKP